MALTATCPNCRAVVNVPGQFAGKTVRCAKCQQVFVAGGPAPAEEILDALPALDEARPASDEEAPAGQIQARPGRRPAAGHERQQRRTRAARRHDGEGEDDRLPRRPPPRSSGSGLVWAFLGGVAALMLLGCGGGALLYFGLGGAAEQSVAPPQEGPGQRQGQHEEGSRTARTQGGAPARTQEGPATVTDFDARVKQGGPNHIFVFVNKGQSALQNVQVWVFLHNENNSRTSVQRFWLSWKPGEEKRVEVPDEHEVVQVALDGTAEAPGPGAPKPVAVKKLWNYDDLAKPN
jgi:hypothetical protein